MDLAVRMLEGYNTEIGVTSIYAHPAKSWREAYNKVTEHLNTHYEDEGYKTTENTVKRILNGLRKLNASHADPASTPNPNSAGGGAGGGEPRDRWTKSLLKFQSRYNEASSEWEKSTRQRKKAEKAKDDADNFLMENMSYQPMTSDEGDSEPSMALFLSEASQAEEDIQDEHQKPPSVASSVGSSVASSVAPFAATSRKPSERSRGKRTTKSDPFKLLAAVENERLDKKLKAEANSVITREAERTKRLKLSQEHEMEMLKERARIEEARDRERARLEQERNKSANNSIVEMMKMMQEQNRAFLLNVVQQQQNNKSN